MTRYLVILLLTAMTALGMEGTRTSSVPTNQSNFVTFNKDVLPILQNNCQSCHRPGGIAPMSLLTYENARPWAKAIKTAVVNKQMPPWFADTSVGEFRNAPKLTAENIKTLVAWAETGSREGDAKDKPADNPQWKDGWRIQPDVIVSMAQAQLVALGMNLGLAKELVNRDPVAAAELIAEAQQSSTTALADLRSLVRGIHPPVLADRGLAGAVQALALTHPRPVDADVALDGRPPAPVESAVYFAVAELLTNSAKHAAAQHTWVWIRHDDGVLTVMVGDDGVGGAQLTAEGGLTGVQRRLAVFDGTLSMASPLGGGTIVTIKVPCVLRVSSAA